MNGQGFSTERIDKLSPLQRSVLHALRGGRPASAMDVFERIELLTPPVLDAGLAIAVRGAIARALERLVAEGLVEITDGGCFAAAPDVILATTFRGGQRLSA